MLITVFILHDLFPYGKCQNIVPIRQLVRELHINATINYCSVTILFRCIT